MTFIMLVYAVYPLIFRVQKLLERKRADLACLIVFCVLYILLCYFLSVRFKDVYDRYEVAATRLPVFLVGSYMGRLVYEKRKFSYGTYLTTALGMIVYLFTLWKPLPFVGARYYKLLLSVGICVIFVVVLSALRLTFLEKLLNFFGGMSLELYLTHNLANEFLFEKGHCDGILQYIIIICVSTAVSYLVSKLRRKIISAYEKQ